MKVFENMEDRLETRKPAVIKRRSWEARSKDDSKWEKRDASWSLVFR